METLERLKEVGWTFEKPFESLEIYERKNLRIIYNPQLDTAILYYNVKELNYDRCFTQISDFNFNFLTSEAP